ncbi:MAG: hypothetical protein WBN83_12420, partial [Desulfoprunum sp.]|jgi:hypothetical protein|uniref:hypothetical protein n=1 Tax=Desulfoprunum sp. TaxID=2020866 RepID=UPI003C74A583
MTMIARLGPQDEMVAVLAQILDMGRVGAETILDDYTLEVRMLTEILPNSGDEGVEVQVFTLADLTCTEVNRWSYATSG